MAETDGKNGQNKERIQLWRFRVVAVEGYLWGVVTGPPLYHVRIQALGSMIFPNQSEAGEASRSSRWGLAWPGNFEWSMEYINIDIDIDSGIVHAVYGIIMGNPDIS